MLTSSFLTGRSAYLFRPKFFIPHHNNNCARERKDKRNPERHLQQKERESDIRVKWKVVG
jgi:hypothetical protein